MTRKELQHLTFTTSGPTIGYVYKRNGGNYTVRQLFEVPKQQLKNYLYCYHLLFSLSHLDVFPRGKGGGGRERESEREREREEEKNGGWGKINRGGGHATHM